MKISTKLIGSFSIVAVICGIVGYIGFHGIQKTGNSIEDIGTIRLPGVQSLLIVQQGAIRINADIGALANEGLTAERREAIYQDVAKTRERYTAAWNAFEQLPQSAQEKEKWNKFVPAWNQWKEENNKAMQLIKQVEAMDVGDSREMHRLVEAFRADHLQLSLKLMAMIQSGQVFRGGTDETLCRFGKFLDTFKTTNPKLQELLSRMKAPHRALHGLVGTMQEMVQTSRKDEAARMFTEQVQPLEEELNHMYDELAGIANESHALAMRADAQIQGPCVQTGDKANDLLDELVKDNTTLAATSAKDGRSAASSARLMAGLAVGFGILLAGAFGVLISRAITKPIHTIVERIKDIAQGEGDLTKRVEVASKDEVGELAKWFNTFVVKVHDIVYEVASATREVAGAATEIAASSEEMAQGIARQTEQTTQVSSAVEEMSSTVVEVARKSSDAAGTADDAGKQANEGGQVVEQTVGGMKTIAKVVNESAEAINELGKRGEQIGQIIGVINDIADQTNLLALNAAIEAARAGEHGRGFAVVADEVRKLAERTTQATKEVAESIKAIQEETTAAVQRMSAGTQTVDDGVKLAERAGQSLHAIVDGSKRVATMIQAIAAAAEQQSAASEQIARNVESINAVTKQSSEGASQAAAAATQLSSKAETLQQLVGQFKLDQRKAA